MENNKIKAIGTLAEIENNDAEIVQEWNSVINSENSNESLVFLIIVKLCFVVQH